MLIIDNAVFSVYPGMRMGVLVLRGVSPAGLYPEKETEARLDGLRQKFAGLRRQELSAQYPTCAYAAYYRKFGQRYPLISQLESVLAGHKTVFARQGLWQVMFLTEMESLLLIAGHDLSALRPPLSLRLADGTETYRTISGRETTCVRGDLALWDGDGVLSSVLRGAEEHSRLSETSVDVLFSVYAPPGVRTETVERCLRTLETGIGCFSPNLRTELCRVYPDESIAE